MLIKINNLLREINEIGYNILVEGKRDRQSLEKLGLQNKIILCANSKPDKIVGKVQSNTAIIMTDLDKTGMELTKKYKEWLKAHNKKSDNIYVMKLAKMLNTKFVEEFYEKYEVIKWQKHT